MAHGLRTRRLAATAVVDEEAYHGRTVGTQSDGFPPGYASALGGLSPLRRRASDTVGPDRIAGPGSRTALLRRTNDPTGGPTQGERLPYGPTPLDLAPLRRRGPTDEPPSRTIRRAKVKNLGKWVKGLFGKKDKKGKGTAVQPTTIPTQPTTQVNHTPSGKKPNPLRQAGHWPVPSTFVPGQLPATRGAGTGPQAGSHRRKSSPSSVSHDDSKTESGGDEGKYLGTSGDGGYTSGGNYTTGVFNYRDHQDDTESETTGEDTKTDDNPNKYLTTESPRVWWRV